jgi:hypothetical protein
MLEVVRRALMAWLDTKYGPLEVRGDEAIIDCPFCGKALRHFSLNLVEGKYNCFSCGTKGYYSTLVSRVENLPHRKGAVQDFLVTNYYTPTLSWGLETEESSSGLVITPGVTEVSRFPTLESSIEGLEDLTSGSKTAMLAATYLESRGVSLELAENLRMKVSTAGRYAARVIVPIIEASKIRNFVARDLLNRKLRWLGPRNEEGWVAKAHLLFNLDAMTEDVIIVEGVFSALGIYKVNPIALLGKTISPWQVEKIVQTHPRRVTVLLDSGFVHDAKRVASFFIGFVPEVLIALMTTPDADPSSHPEEALRAIHDARDALTL